MKNEIETDAFLFQKLFWPTVRDGILLPNMFWPTVRKKCSSDREKLLKFEAEGQEFAKILRSLKCRFCKKLLLYEYNSDQLLTFFHSVIIFGWVCCCFAVAPTKKWATGRIRKEVTSYKIHTLGDQLLLIFFWKFLFLRYFIS